MPMSLILIKDPINQISRTKFNTENVGPSGIQGPWGPDAAAYPHSPPKIKNFPCHL